jgi:hypothetical protein
MNRFTLVLLVTSCLYAFPPVGQESAGSTPSSSEPKGVVQSTKGTSSTRANRGGVFEGVVVRIDASSRTISVRARGVVVNFDLSNATLSGYRSLSEIRPGNRVALSYKEDGVTVKRLREKTGNGQEKSSTVRKAPEVGKPATVEKKLRRRQPNGGGGGFEDADVNKDGKITPVELSLLIHDITMERFKKYDKDGNGTLDRAEFAEAIRQERASTKPNDQ